MAKSRFGNFVTNWTPLGWLGQLYGKVFKSQTLSDLGAAVENAVKYYSHSGVTDERKEDLKLQDEYLDENRKAEQDWQEYFYNKYQSAPAQVAQYQEAGLNPMLLAGGAAGASAATSPSGQAPSSSQSSADPIAALMSIVSVASQAQDLGASADLKKSQKSYQDIVNKWKDKQEQADYNLKIANTELVGANISKISEDAKVAAVYAKFAPQLFGSQVALNDANASKAIADADKAYSDIKLNEAEIGELNARVKKYAKEMLKIDSELVLIEQQALESASQTYLNDARAQESYQNIKESEQKVKNMMAELGFTEKEIEYYIWNHPRQSGAAGFKWNSSSDNGRSRSNIEQYSDDDILRAARARGLISE